MLKLLATVIACSAAAVGPVADSSNVSTAKASVATVQTVLFGLQVVLEFLGFV